jgi:hypothetical protein
MALCKTCSRNTIGAWPPKGREMDSLESSGQQLRYLVPHGALKPANTANRNPFS